MTEFRIECFQNEYLPEGADVMNAVITVVAGGTSPVSNHDTGVNAGSTDRAELVIIDTSGSMMGSKLHEAKAATAELKAKLADVRAARQQKEADLAKTQEDLKQLLSVRQEAVAVMFGLVK